MRNVSNTYPPSPMKLCQQLESILFEHEDHIDDTVLSAVASIVQNLCVKGMLHGNLDNATFTPRIYLLQQREICDSFYNTNGYLTEKKCAAFGISRNRMEKFVKESFVCIMCVLYFIFWEIARLTAVYFL